jgi:prefoldin subunit 5
VAPYPANQGISPEDETNMLKQQAEYMKQSLDAINKRLAEIEKKK